MSCLVCGSDDAATDELRETIAELRKENEQLVYELSVAVGRIETVLQVLKHRASKEKA